VGTFLCSRGFVCFGSIVLTAFVGFGIAVFAPLASYFSFYSKRKVTKRMPPTSLALDNCSCVVLILSIHGHIRVPEFSSVANEPALMRRPGAQG